MNLDEALAVYLTLQHEPARGHFEECLMQEAWRLIHHYGQKSISRAKQDYAIRALAEGLTVRPGSLESAK